MRAVLEDNIKLREKSEARFQAFFDKELNRLKNDFRTEAEVRLIWSDPFRSLLLDSRELSTVLLFRPVPPDGCLLP